MSKFSLDLKSFKKISSDNNTSTLRHPQGHEIKIAHVKLSPKMKEQLDHLPIHKFAEGGEAEDSKSNEIPVEKNAEKVPLYGAPVNAATPQFTGIHEGMDLPDSAPQEISQQKLAPNIGSELGQTPSAPQGAVASNPTDVSSALSQQLAGVQKVGAGQEAEAQAIGAQGAANLAQEQAYQVQAQKNLDNYNQAIAPYMKERQAIMSDIAATHINPNKYIQSMSTGHKIAIGIDLVLGGMGAGMSHGPNLAFKYLNDQIDRDIQGQKDELGKKQSLLAHNMQQTHSLAEAYGLTKMQTNDMLSSHLRMVADQTADPLAKARVMQLAGQTDQQTSQIMQQMAINKMRMGGESGSSDPAKLVPFLVPKEHQNKAFSEIEAAENTKKMSASILNSFEQAANENTVLKTGAGLLRTPGSVYALHQSMQPTFKDLEGTVRQAAMDNTFKNITPAPGDSEHTISIKREALQDYLKSKLSAPTARAYGIDLTQNPRTSPYELPQMKTMGGVQYKKVPGGWKKVQ